MATAAVAVQATPALAGDVCDPDTFYEYSQASAPVWDRIAVQDSYDVAPGTSQSASLTSTIAHSISTTVSVELGASAEFGVATINAKISASVALQASVSRESTWTVTLNALYPDKPSRFLVRAGLAKYDINVKRTRYNTNCTTTVTNGRMTIAGRIFQTINLDLAAQGGDTSIRPSAFGLPVSWDGHSSTMAAGATAYLDANVYFPYTYRQGGGGSAPRKADIVVTGSDANWAVALSNGSSFGGWSGIGLTQWSHGDWSGVADVNGDGRADIVVHNPQYQRYDVAISDGTGSFGIAPSGTWLSDWNAGDWAGLGDVNGDGKADLVVHNPTYNRLDVALSNGTSFVSSGGWMAGWGVGDFAALADVNGDGKADYVTHNPSAMRFDVALSNGSSFYSGGAWLSQWAKGDFAALADVNGDRRADIVVHNPQFMRFDVALSNGSSFNGGGGTWLSQWAAGDWAAVGDVNGDGRADVVVHNPQFMRFDVALSNGSSFNGGGGTWLSQWAKGDFAALADVNGA